MSGDSDSSQSDHPWRDHPALQGKFHPEFPDDLQVLVHQGGPRLSDRHPEVVWVRVTGMHLNVFSGVVLNQPEQLDAITAQSQIQFVPAGGPFPLLVTAEYLEERPHWTIKPCDRCGLSELMDAPSELIYAVFSRGISLDQYMVFTTFCGYCGGVLILERPSPDVPRMGSPVEPRAKWWQFWRRRSSGRPR